MMTPEAMSDLASKVVFADWRRREAEKACRAKGTTFKTVLRKATVARAIEHWGEAMQWFIYKCVTPSGRVDGHFRFVQRDATNRLVCAFCKRPSEEGGDGDG